MKNNYLDKIPVRASEIAWSTDDDGNVTLEVENKGIFNRIFQKLFHKPRISYINLDETGSFVWPLIDGEKSIAVLGEEVEKQFGSKAHPLYERLVKFFDILESYRFIDWK